LKPAVDLYVDSFVQKFFQGYGDREWANECDLLLIVTEAMTALFTAQVSDVLPAELQELIFLAHDRAMDEAKNLPVVWDAVRAHVQGPATRKKVYKALENSRKICVDDAALGCSTEFAQAWIKGMHEALDLENGGWVENVLTEESCKTIFSVIVECGGLPAKVVAADVQPGEGWVAFIASCVADTYAKPEPEAFPVITAYKPSQPIKRPMNAGAPKGGGLMAFGAPDNKRRKGGDGFVGKGFQWGQGGGWNSDGGLQPEANWGGELS
jgi:hypothetical protein